MQVKIALNNLGNTLCVTSRWVTVGNSFLEAYRFVSQEERFRSSFGTLSFLRMERLLSSLWKIEENSSSALVRRGREWRDSGVAWRSAGNIKCVAHSPKGEEPRTLHNCCGGGYR